MKRLTLALTLAALGLAPGSAGAADTVVVPGAVAPRMTALDGVVVWATGTGSSASLMQRTADGVVRPVQGAPAASYPSIDLGLNHEGDLVLTYLRCTAAHRCAAYSDDLDGHRTKFKHLVPQRCALAAAPARWQERVAYGLNCSKLGGKPGVFDPGRSGLFVRKGAGPAKHLKRPDEANGVGRFTMRFVDLRGTTVGAAMSAIGDIAYALTVNGTRRRSTGAAEGDLRNSSIVTIDALSLGADAELWTLNGTSTVELPYQPIITGLGRDCEASEPLPNPADPSSPVSRSAWSMAVDGRTTYVYVPGTGIVTHAFATPDLCSG